jgi:hypothetical protein
VDVEEMRYYLDGAGRIFRVIGEDDGDYLYEQQSLTGGWSRFGNMKFPKEDLDDYRELSKDEVVKIMLKQK